MGKITYFDNQDYKIELENWKLFKIDDEQFLFYKNTFIWPYDETFKYDEIYNNNFIDWLYNMYNHTITLNYKDADYNGLEEVIKFNLLTYLWESPMTIDWETFKELANGEHWITFYLYDNIKNLFWEVGYFQIMKHHKDKLEIVWKTYFDKTKFIQSFIAPNYLSKKQWILETFSFTYWDIK